MIFFIIGVRLIASFRDLPALFEPVGIERDPDMGPSPRTIEKGNFAKMFLDDLLDDGEPQPGPAHARRHIRLGEPLALFGQPDPGVDDVDH